MSDGMRTVAFVMVLLMAAATAPADPVLHPAPDGLTPSAIYEVTVNGRPLFVYPCRVGAAVKDERGTLDPDPPETTTPRPAALCYFDSARPTEIVVTVSKTSPHRDLKTALVRPSRHKIRPRVEGRTIAFRAPGGPCQLSVEPNGSAFAPLLVFVNRPEQDAPRPDDPEVTHYFGPGLHEVGMLTLKAGEKVYLAGGAVVHGQIACRKADEVRVFGRGILDAGRAPSKPSGGRKPPDKPIGRYANQLHLANGRGCRVEGIILLDSPSWVLHLRNCRDAAVRNVKIISWRENGDGIDVVASQDVTVEDCFVRSWDDALVVKSYLYDPQTKRYLWGGSKVNWKKIAPRLRAPEVRNVAFRRCVIWLDRAHALEIGKETAARAISDIEFSDIDIIHGFHVAAMDIQSGDRAAIRGVRFRDIRLEDQRSRHLIQISYGPTMWNADPHLGTRLGVIRDVRFENIHVTGRLPGSLIQNTAPPRLQAPPEAGAVIDDIRIRNLTLDGRAITTQRGLKLRRKGDRLGRATFEK
jgi:hypothetical protein